MKNTEFLIKGSVTEFQYVSGGAIRLLKNRMGLGGSGQIALVTVTLYVIDVESGQILASETIDGRASTGSISFESQYRDIAFGGSAFYKTPLGKATKKVIGKCLKSISRAISQTLWEPRVIRIEDQQIYVSGGIDRGMKKNTHWLVFEKGEPLIDPETGDKLGMGPGKLLGQVRIREVHDRHSVAELVDGFTLKGAVLKKPD